ncbi:AMP-binding protein [Streptomyces sp. NPDC099088]|uniref:AMP-binding protein n=1 Tax=Streptomyces sp. NPDC099088 TaxID=3366101 RepID=UPI00380F7D2F
MTIATTYTLPFSSPLPGRSDATVVDLFEQTADHHESAIAVRQGARTLTYEQLAAHVNLLARVFRNAGVETGDVLGINGRSMLSVATVLAVLKTGAAILPLEPSLTPAERDRLLQISGARAQVMSTEEACTLLPSTAVPHIARPGSAYVQFTSDSNGDPKGIVARHGGLSHYTRWQRDTFAIAPGDRVGQLANWSLEVIIREILTPLISGATLCLPTERSLQASHIFAFARDCALTILHVVPSLARHWIADPTSDLALPALRTTFFAGEPLTSSLVHSWRQRVNTTAAVVNLYGSTETTLAKCHHVTAS